MFDTLDAILEQVRAGEDSFAEFKEVRFGNHAVISPNTEEMAGEFVAFANADGGAVFLGVSDEGLVTGLARERADELERWVINIATNNCDPPIRPSIRRAMVPDPSGTEVLLILVEIKKSLYVHRSSGGRYYLRVGTTKTDMTAAELARLFQQRGRMFVFDEQPVPTASPDQLNHKLVVETLGDDLRIPLSDLLRNTRVVVQDGSEQERPTVAGMLAFGTSPLHHLPSAFIEAAVYRGTVLSSDDLVHSEKINGPVTNQIDGAYAFVERFMLIPSKKPVGREDFPQYSLGAIYEAIVNAVAHRDYSVSGSKIRLYLFADRLELYSPGSLPNTVTLETMAFRVFTRNQLLVAFLAKMKSRITGSAYLESRGEGVRRILDESEKHSGRRPQYRLFGPELLLTIWAKPSPHDQSTG